MKTRLTVVGLEGSLAEKSNSRAALEIALEGAAEAEAQTELLDIRSLALPFYNPEIDSPPDSDMRLCDAVCAADGLIWTSPMYQGTISGSFKNVLDWLHLHGDRNPPFPTDKEVGLISTAGGVQGLQAVNTMEFIVCALHGWAVPLVMPIAQVWKAFDRTGAPQDSRLTEQLHALGREVARASCQFAPEPPTRPDAAKAEVAITPLNEREAHATQQSFGSNCRHIGGHHDGRRS
jgi:FMN reductase